uniref:Uncharacterized protein LOC108039113 n=1 Tax=Drosophila rhopaloa TaxID=1041015 RepID=A0A6P4EDW4_DRORH
MVDHLNSFFGSNGGNGREKGGDDEITIIDNGAVPPVFASPPASDFQEDLVAPVPEAVPSDPSALAPEPPVDPETPVEAEPVVDPDDLYPADPSAPPAGQSICVVVKVPQPDPKDPTKTIEVDQSACYQESTAETDPSAIGWD